MLTKINDSFFYYTDRNFTMHLNDKKSRSFNRRIGILMQIAESGNKEYPYKVKAMLTPDLCHKSFIEGSLEKDKYHLMIEANKIIPYNINIDTILTHVIVNRGIAGNVSQSAQHKETVSMLLNDFSVEEYKFFDISRDDDLCSNLRGVVTTFETPFFKTQTIAEYFVRIVADMRCPHFQHYWLNSAWEASPKLGSPTEYGDGWRVAWKMIVGLQKDKNINKSA